MVNSEQFSQLCSLDNIILSQVRKKDVKIRSGVAACVDKEVASFGGNYSVRYWQDWAQLQKSVFTQFHCFSLELLVWSLAISPVSELHKCIGAFSPKKKKQNIPSTFGTWTSCMPKLIPAETQFSHKDIEFHFILCHLYSWDPN